jgi:glycolate oxidase
MFDGREPGALERAEVVAGEVIRMCIRRGGSITGEHGVGMEKRAYLPELFSAVDLAVMQRIRHSIDPQQLSNPGKMFPDSDAAPPLAAGPHALERAGVISRM